MRDRERDAPSRVILLVIKKKRTIRQEYVCHRNLGATSRTDADSTIHLQHKSSTRPPSGFSVRFLLFPAGLGVCWDYGRKDQDWKGRLRREEPKDADDNPPWQHGVDNCIPRNVVRYQS